MRTVAKLRILCNDLILDGYTNQVPETVLFRRIMENFGAEQPIVRDVAKSLRILGFMKPLATGVWEFTGEFAPKEEKPAQKEENAPKEEKNIETPREEQTEIKTDEFGNAVA